MYWKTQTHREMSVSAARLSLTNFFMRKICHIQNACPVWKAFMIHESCWLIVYIRYILNKWEVIVLIAMLRLYEIKNDCLFFWTKVYPFINVPSYCFISSFCIWHVFLILRVWFWNWPLTSLTSATLSTSWMSKKRKLVIWKEKGIRNIIMKNRE